MTRRLLRETGEDGKRGRLVEPVVRIDVGHMLIGLRIGRHFHVAVEAEDLPDRHLHVGQAGDFLRCGSHCSSVVSEATETRFRSTECGRIRPPT